MSHVSTPMFSTPTVSSVQESLMESFKTIEETNIRVIRGIQYKNGYGADLKTVYFTDKVKLIGIMFCHPESEIGARDVIPRLEYLHYRSGENTDLFWAGYHRYCALSDIPIKTTVDGILWGFSNAEFNSFRSDIEGRTTWEFSGETDLLLTTARFDQTTNKPYLDFSETLVCDLDEMIRRGAITSVSRFLEDVFRFGDTNPSSEVYDFSDLKFIEKTKHTLLNWFLDRIHMREYFERTAPFAIRDISKTICDHTS
jgi:hypothetical protein